MHWTVRGLRDPKLTEDALDFVRLLLGADVKHIALENPVGAISTRIRKPDCVIHPWQFGTPESKTTCLWLKNLPPLQPTDICQKPASGRWENQTPSGQNKLGQVEGVKQNISRHRLGDGLPVERIRILFASECGPCPDCGEPYCDRCMMHYADCNCVGPDQAEEMGYSLEHINGTLYGVRTINSTGK